jgi:hypothetical protein
MSLNLDAAIRMFDDHQQSTETEEEFLLLETGDHGEDEVVY